MQIFQWAKFCAQPNEWIPGPRSRICQHHFKPEDLLGTDKHIVPKSFAVPSIIVSPPCKL